MKTISPKQLVPLLEGVSILGTGGGGSPSWGKKIFEKDYELNREYKIISPDKIENDATVVSGGIMGSVKTLEEMDFSQLLNKWEDDFILENALIEMEKELNDKIDYIVPFEMGALNTIAILSLGARLNIPVIDGDAIGRAAPETQMTSFVGHGIDLTPMPLVDRQGNVVVVREANNIFYPDQVGRYVVTNGGGLGANNHYPMSGKDLKESVISGTISRAIEIGEVVISARENNKNPIDKLIEKVEGQRFFKGEIIDITEAEERGFYVTKVFLEGLDQYKGDKGELVIKNETMALWIDGELQIMFPDLLLMLDPKDARGIMSVELEAGLELELVGLSCDEKLRAALKQPKGEKAFSPKRYGLDLNYRTMEELN